MESCLDKEMKRPDKSDKGGIARMHVWSSEVIDLDNIHVLNCGT